MRAADRICRAIAAIAVSAVAAGFLSGCAPSEEYGEADPRGVTQEEAERLAVARFNNFDRGAGQFTLTMQNEDADLYLEGRIDFRDHVGYGSLLVDGADTTRALVIWSEADVAVTAAPGEPLPPQPPVDARWSSRPLDADGEPFDTALMLAVSLAADRPENPLLLRQNGAEWHGTTTIDGTEVDVLSGPGSDNLPSDDLLYFVDDDGALLRLIADVPGSGADAVLEFPPGDATPIDSPLDD